MIKNNNIVLICFILIAILIFIIPLDLSLSQESSIKVSTREHFNLDSGELKPGYTITEYNAINVPGLQVGNCPDESVIYVHGFLRNENQAEEEAERINLVLTDKNYSIPVISFTWDSNSAPSSLFDFTGGWDEGKKIANANGKKLAQFILDFKGKCSDTDLRIIAHSLGSRVTFSAINSLFNEPLLNFKISSIHLLGAAIDNEQVSIDASDCISNQPQLSCSGKSIEKVVEKFYNLYNPEDNLLQISYPKVEPDSALGLKGSEFGIRTPAENYYSEYNVRYEIPLDYYDADANYIWDCLEFDLSPTWGDNHCGYMGYRSLLFSNYNTIKDDGAMDLVVNDWKNN
jgi:Alpha/beta hydrolase of unknown function (DUF900)